MSKTGTAFERDRNRLLRLLREIDMRIAEVEDDTSIGDILPLVREMENADLSVRLGYFGQPLIFEERRDNPQFEVERTLLCNDPHGTRCDFIQLSGVLTSSHLDSIADRSKGNDRQRLRRAVGRWIRDLEVLEEPEVYPASPGYFVPGVPRELWADALWRELYFAISMFEDGTATCWGPAHGFGTQSSIDKINQLVRESGLAAHLPFGRSSGVGLHVYDVEGTQVVDLMPATDGGLERPTEDDLQRLTSCLRKWQAARADQMGQHFEPLPGSKSTKPIRKKGRPATHDSAKDKKLASDWSVSGQLQEEFETARGLESGEVSRAKDRTKAAARRERSTKRQDRRN